MSPTPSTASSPMVICSDVDDWATGVGVLTVSGTPRCSRVRDRAGARSARAACVEPPSLPSPASNIAWRRARTFGVILLSLPPCLRATTAPSPSFSWTLRSTPSVSGTRPNAAASLPTRTPSSAEQPDVPSQAHHRKRTQLNDRGTRDEDYAPTSRSRRRRMGGKRARGRTRSPGGRRAGTCRDQHKRSRPRKRRAREERCRPRSVS